MCSRWKVHYITCFGIIILCLLYLNSVECSHWDPHVLHSNISRFRRQAECRDEQFRCADGTCIAGELECDGKEDCIDGSDEIDCKDLVCNSLYGFRCDYGACVKRNARCNGKKECKDNSDEKGCPNATPAPTTNNVCVSETSFTCRSGECIDNEQLCDGRANCSDNSDETEEECAGLNCINAFRCKYGACVAKNARCNRIKECFDGSDEQGCPTPKPVTPQPPVTPKPVVTPAPKPAPDGSCVVPKVPANGVFVNNNNPSVTFKPGDIVPNFNALITKCNRQYKTTPPNKSFPICISGSWTAPPLQCARFCSSANSSKTTKITCKFGGLPIESCAEPVDGTIVSIKCEYLYEGQSGNPNRICRDGSWDYPITECRPVCGQKRAKGKPTIINGAIATPGDYPWHIGIYVNNERKRYLCGGSILNRAVIVSAAHCFTDNDGNLLPKENYLIAAGKYYRPYDDERDENAQYSTIKTVYKPERYKGVIGNYEGDIAVVVLTKAFQITLSVQPVCVDWNNEFEYQQLSENNMGVVVGWGYTKPGEQPSVELKELNTPYISYDQCFEQVPIDFRRLLTYDKVCAGFLNKGTSVCEGDSGGGLTFPRNDDRYFIRGIVSTSPGGDNSCDPDQYSTYTLISKHLDFIKDIEIVNRII